MILRVLSILTFTMLVGTGNVLAEARELYKCSIAAGASYDDVLAAYTTYRNAMNKAGYSDYHVELLTPLYDDEAPPGTLYWQGTSPTMERLGAANDWFWFHEDGGPSREAFAKTLHCHQARMYFVDILD
jgi:hypothetical protein